MELVVKSGEGFEGNPSPALSTSLKGHQVERFFKACELVTSPTVLLSVGLGLPMILRLVNLI